MAVKHIGERMRELREERMLTSKRVAEILQLTPQCYSHYEMGRRNPGIQDLISLSKLYGITLDEMVDGVYFGKTSFEELTEKPVDYGLSSSERRELSFYREYLIWKRSKSD
ncbi:MAG: helix-turn-helix transcriptional regulator [Firmicutes bacterium]|nr:helix-turn-helix transcriptional regulator [Bacillota bacterium]